MSEIKTDTPTNGVLSPEAYAGGSAYCHLFKRKRTVAGLLTDLQEHIDRLERDLRKHQKRQLTMESELAAYTYLLQRWENPRDTK
jgi:hypothetical protein